MFPNNACFVRLYGRMGNLIILKSGSRGGEGMMHSPSLLPPALLTYFFGLWPPTSTNYSIGAFSRSHYLTLPDNTSHSTLPMICHQSSRGIYSSSGIIGVEKPTTTKNKRENNNIKIEILETNTSEWTAWVNAIQVANIVKLNPTQEWANDESSIQVKRMNKLDLNIMSEDLSLPVSEHAYDDALDVVKLPLAIPEEQEDNCAPQFLFIRPDDYELFRCTRLSRFKNSIIIGNPGISKSWFQWKFILFSYRPELFHQLWPSTFMQHQVVDGENLLNSSTIIRTTAGKESYRFPIQRETCEVSLIRHNPEDLKLFTDNTVTILWEPGVREAPIHYQGIRARIIATVSPNENRIHELKKRAKMFFMPCPSELQLRLMGKVYRAATNRNSTNFPSDAEIHRRVRKYGPYIRLCLSADDHEVATFERMRNKDLKLVCQSGMSIINAFQLSTDYLKESSAEGWTHRVARYDVNRDQSTLNDVYGSYFYRSSSKDVSSLILETIDKVQINELTRMLFEIDLQSFNPEKNMPKILEHFFEYHATNGFEWKCRQLHLSSGHISSDVDWKVFKLKLHGPVKETVEFQSMDENVLYYPKDPTFPLVDFYYKDKNGKLFGIQVTLASKHPKKFSVYQRFYNKIRSTPEATPLALYYFILPQQVNSFSHVDYRDGMFWENLAKGVPQRWRENVTFHVLIPPKTFEAKFE